MNLCCYVLFITVSLTIDALEVEEVGSVVHLVELQAHFHQVSRHWILPPHSQMVRVHHLQHQLTDNLVRI